MIKEFGTHLSALVGFSCENLTMLVVFLVNRSKGLSFLLSFLWKDQSTRLSFLSNWSNLTASVVLTTLGVFLVKMSKANCLHGLSFLSNWSYLTAWVVLTTWFVFLVKLMAAWIVFLVKRSKQFDYISCLTCEQIKAICLHRLSFLSNWSYLTEWVVLTTWVVFLVNRSKPFVCIMGYHSCQTDMGCFDYMICLSCEINGCMGCLSCEKTTWVVFLANRSKQFICISYHSCQINLIWLHGLLGLHELSYENEESNLTAWVVFLVKWSKQFWGLNWFPDLMDILSEILPLFTIISRAVRNPPKLNSLRDR